MFVLGLTGSIGMGKSTTAKMFAEEGVPVHDADAAVHNLYAGEAVAVIEAAFPGTTVNGKVNREKLGKRVLGDQLAMKRLEHIVHPLVRKAEERFLTAAQKKGAKVALLDIPLLYETGGDKRCDAVVVVSAPAELQRARAFETPRHDARKICRDPGQANSLTPKSAARRFRGGYLERIGCRRAPRCVIFSRRSLRCRSGIADLSPQETTCARSSSTLKPPVSTPPKVIAWSRWLHRTAEPDSDRCDVPRLFNPDRDMPAEAFAVHGLSSEFLKGQKRFADIVDEFLVFIGDAPLVIHNAGFDHGFLCAELKRVERALISRERLVDTLMLARRKHPAGPNRLDDLCARYGIDNSLRTKHGALLDAEILAEVYLELIGARQAQLGLAEKSERRGNGRDGAVVERQREVALMPRITEADRAAHRDFVATLGEKALWQDYLTAGT